MKTVLNFLLFAAFVLGVFVNTGCSPDHTYLYCEFQVEQQKDTALDVVCEIDMRGTFFDLPNKEDGEKSSIKKSPYDFFIWLDTNRKDICSATINSFIFATPTGKTLHRADFIGENNAFVFVDEEIHRASFLFDDLDVEHEKCTVKIEVIFELKSGEQIPATYSIKLTPVERKEERVDWWDNIMSV